MRRTSGLLAALMVLMSASALLVAQVDYSTATLKGTVFDPQGRVIPGAQVTVRNPSTGWRTVVRTSPEGIYRTSFIPPGEYELRVEAATFAPEVATVAASVGQVVNHEFHLKIGRTNETIEISSEAPLISVEQTQQANTIGQRQIADLPNLSHLFTHSIFTLPGVSSSEAPRSQTPGFTGFQSTGFSFGGSNGRSNLVTIDGGENDVGWGQLRTPHLPVDAVQEFQVNRSSFAAEFGFTAGTAINVVTRSGTNQWHGSGHAWFRNEHTDATNYFALRTGEKAFEQDFLAGFTVAGPLVKNRLFLFIAYEFTKNDSPQFRNYAATDAAKGIRSNAAQQNYVHQLAASGDSELQAVAGQLQFLLDPSNFPNTAKLLVPNSGAFNEWKKYHNWITRFDYQPRISDAITVRFSFKQDDSSAMSILDPLNAPDAAILEFLRDYTILGAWTHAFNSAMINQLRIQVAPGLSGDVPVVSPHTAFLRIAGLGQFGGEHYEPWSARAGRFQFEDSATVARGSHTIKFGASYRPFRYVLRNELWFGGEFQFWDGMIPIVGGLIQPSSSAFAPLLSFNLAHGLPADGDPATYLTALQTFDLGIPVTFRQGFGNPRASGLEHYFGGYTQDSWKVSRSLTIDFGGRLDVYAPASPVPLNVYVSPRVGFAWSPGGKQKTVIRGGGGIFVAPVPFFIGNGVNLLSDSGRYINQVATSLSLTDQRVLTLWAMLTGCDPQQPYICSKQPPFRQLQAADLNAAGLQVGPGQPGRVITSLMKPFRNNYSVQASLGVQRQLGSNTAAELTYQMLHSIHLPCPFDTNVRETGVIDPFVGPMYAQTNPDIIQLATIASLGSSIYHAVMASLTRRFARGLQFQINYTFSKTIDDTTDFNAEFMPFRPTRRELERSLSTFDIRHNFVAQAVYATPFKTGDGLVSHALADMTIAPVLFLRSGIPFTIRVPGMQNGTLGESLWARPWDAGRNTGIGPNFFSLEMRVNKSFYFNRDAGQRLDFTVQVTNFLNHTNFSAVNDSFPANPNPFQVGGQTVDLLNGPYNLHGIRGLDASQPLAFKAAFDPRQVQVGLKLVF